jgi:drug/metabolite transporter (DMT)-like permease
MSRDSRAGVVAALVTVQVLFGVHYFVAKILLQSIPPRAWAVLRVAAAAGILLVIARLLGRRLPSAPADLRQLALFAVFGVVINQVCFVEGLSRTTPTHSSIIMTSTPVAALLFGVLLKRESCDIWKLLSLVVSFAGVMLVVLGGQARGSGLLEGASGRMMVGDLLTLINALSYSFFLVISKRLLTRTDPLGATAVLLAFGSLGIFAVGAPTLSAVAWSEVPASVWGMGAFIVVFPTALAYLLMYWALARVDSFLVALFIYLQPVIASTLSAAFLGERIGPRIVLGGGLIFLGVYLALRPWRRSGENAGSGASS